MILMYDLSMSMQTRTSKLISKYEKQIEELTSQCTMKSNECYMAWSSVASSNEELNRLKIELHRKGAEMDSLGMDYASSVTIFAS